jgi:DOPA 4,5-dioxygenase
MEYHAHIYWTTPEESANAISFRENLADLGCKLGRVWDQPIGPHPLPMYQAVYDSSNKDLVEQYLTVNRGSNTILLHESINDDLRDHTDGARWLGQALALKLEIFNE